MGQSDSLLLYDIIRRATELSIDQSHTNESRFSVFIIDFLLFHSTRTITGQADFTRAADYGKGTNSSIVYLPRSDLVTARKGTPY